MNPDNQSPSLSPLKVPPPAPHTPIVPASPTPSVWKAILKEIVIFIAIAVGIVLPFRALVAEPYIVEGGSMDPTFTTGDYLIVDKISYELGEPKRGSVVVFKFPVKVPGETARNLIKRIIGIPGDTVTMKDTTITITNAENPKGFAFDQTIIKNLTNESFTVTLADGEYFVMGDNRPVSYDSRSWGKLPRKDIIGRPFLRLLPIGEIGVWPGAE